MATALGHKAWTDLSRRPARAVLTALTLALAVASFGILALPSLMEQAMTTEVANARLYDLAVPVHDVALSPAETQSLAKLPNVTGLTARDLFSTTALIGSQRVSTEVWGVPNFADQPVDRVTTNTLPGPGEVLVDVQDSKRGISSATTGDRVRVQTADGSFRLVEVAGSGRDIALDQDTQTNRLVLYAAQRTVQHLGGFNGVNYLEFRLQDPTQPAANRTIAAIRSVLSKAPSRTSFSNVPTVRAPGDWPGKTVFDQRTKILIILIVLAVLSAALLLANTIRTMMAEQTREIGVMRSIGAGRREIRSLYMRTAVLLGVLGSIVGVVLGIGMAYALVYLFAGMFWGVDPSFAVDWPVVVASALAGVVLAVFIAEVTIGRALRTPVRQALEDEGLVAGFGSNRLDRLLLHLRGLPPPMLIGVRNIGRQRARSITTIVQIALAVATLLALLSLALAVSEVTDQSWNVLDYDITLSAQPGGHFFDPAIVNTVRAQPGVSGIEAVDWSQMTYRGQTLYALGSHAHTFVHEPLTAGRWLTPQDVRTAARVVVVGSAAARLWNFHPGSDVTLTTADGPETFRVIGVGGSQANNGFNVYMPLPVLQRAMSEPGLANSLLIRATNKSHPSINELTTRLQNTLASNGYLSRFQIMYSGRANDQAQAHTTLFIVESIGLLIVAISMLGLINAITMNIIERTREIGVLRSLGARARDVRRIFRTETMALALIGFVLAVPLGWLLAHALRWLVLHVANAQLPAPYAPGNLVLALIGTIALAAVVAAAPLRHATRLRPGDAIRYN